MTTRSLSEDELQSMEGQARKLTILDLKKQALAAKQGGNLEFAMDCLKRSKKLELEDSESGLEEDEEPPYSSTLPLFWKKVRKLKNGNHLLFASPLLPSSSYQPVHLFIY